MIHTLDNPKKITYFYSLDSDFTGVAINFPGTIAYYQYGKLHREDGPAIIYSGKEINSFLDLKRRYFLLGKNIEVSSDEEFERYVKLRMFE